MAAMKAATIFNLATLTSHFIPHNNLVYFAWQLVSVSEMSLKQSFENKQNVQNIMIAAKKAVTVLNVAILTQCSLHGQ